MMTEIDSKTKGDVTTTHAAGTSETTTSAIVECKGKNALLVEVTISGGAANWTFKVQGALKRNGTYFDLYQQNAAGTWTAMSYQFNASRMFVVYGIPDYIKIVATEDAGSSTVEVRVQPFVM